MKGLTMEEERKIRFNIARALQTMPIYIHIESVRAIAGTYKEIHVTRKNFYKYNVLVEGTRVVKTAVVV